MFTLGLTTTLTFGDLAGVRNTLTFYEADGQTLTDLGGAEYAAVDVSLDFSAENTEGYENIDTLLKRIRGASFEATGFKLFNQSDTSGPSGSWLPQFSLDVPGTSISNIDSFLTIGGEVGALAPDNNTIFAGSAWGDASGPTIFNRGNLRWANYDIPQTELDSTLLVWIGRFVVSGEEARNGASFNISGDADYNYGPGTAMSMAPFEADIIFTPAPGALALLGLGGVVNRRRRN